MMRNALTERIVSISKFALVPAFSMVTTLLVLPLVSSQFGADGIIALNIGQSIGALSSVAVGMGWPVTGANAVAGATVEERREVAVDSILSRGLVFLLLLAPTVAASWLFSPVHRIEAVVFAVATMLNGFTFAWYYAGVNRPRLLLRNEALMRLGGNVLALPLLWVTKSLIAYALLMVIVGCAMILMNLQQVVGRMKLSSASWARAWQQTLQQLPLAGARMVTASGYYLSSTLVSAVARPSLGAFSASDKMQKSLGNAAEAVPAGLAGWVSSAAADSPARARRVAHAVRFCVAVSVLILIAWLIVGDWVTRILFSGQIHLSTGAQIANAVAISAAFASSSLAQLAMVPTGNVRVVTVLSPLCAVVGLALTAAGARYGLTGALWGASSSNLIQAVAYLLVAIRWNSSRARLSTGLPVG